jgi:type II secretory pathway pseudopilin PulG
VTRRLTSSRGFVLPTTLMVMTLLTVLITAAFIMVSAEFRTSDNALAVSRANAMAQAGLQDYMSRNRGIGVGSSWDSIRITYADGYADIVGTRLVAQSGTRLPMWVIRSTAVLTGNMLTGMTTAQSTAAQLAQVSPGQLPLKAAFVSAGQVTLTGGASSIEPIVGTDECNSGITDTLGLLVVSTTGTMNGITVRNMSKAAILDSTHVDWASLLNGNFTPDYTVTPWPGSWSGYPTFYAAGDLTMTGGHVGTLVVKGNLALGAGASWKGIVIVGGTITSIGTGANIRGAVITGLNELVTPNSVGTTTIARGLNPQPFQWNSCEAGFAVAAMAGISPLRHTFIDTWSY